MGIAEGVPDMTEQSSNSCSIEELPLHEQCTTRYPLLLVHGVASKNAEKYHHWGRIPRTLREHGAEVYVSSQDAWGSHTSNAWQLHHELSQIVEDHQIDKVNIIAHSKGGIDTRVLATLPGMSERIASITTLSSPHYGVRALDVFELAPKLLQKVVSTPIDIAMILKGDENPSFVMTCGELGTLAMRQFNELYPLPQEIYFQSFSVVQKSIFTDLFFAASLPVIHLTEGENDGLVPETSTRFGSYQGRIGATGRWGLSHRDIVDQSLADMLPDSPSLPWSEYLSRQHRNRDSFDVLAWWVELVADLKRRGF